MFSLRIVNVDHYMSPPKKGFDLTYSQFRGSTIKSVPVIRIFGATPSGDKTCLHVHGVFPYVLVPYSGAQDAGPVMYQLASSLDKAINVSLGSSYSNKQYVFKITQVSGRPYYGYHGQDHQFLKIFFYTPLIIKRACGLLQNGAVCGTRFQIHEGHVPFTLQFFIDYNLYGMSFINVKRVVYRKGCNNQPGEPVSIFSKDSVCELEADTVAIDILNRIKVEGEMAVNPGLAAIWEEERKRLNKGILDESSYRPTPPLATSEVLLKEKLLDNLKLQGKFKAPLRENIPYPAETQCSNSNDMFDASVLDTHSITSLVPSHVFRDENTQIDEEIIQNLTQNVPISSGELSLLAALDDLATHNDMSQNIEDDSILGSQAVADCVSDDDDNDDDHGLNYSLLLPNPYLQDSSEDSDTSFEDNIPQLDGVGDIKKKVQAKSKMSSFKNKENTSNKNPIDESDTPDGINSNQTSLVESENKEINDAVFQDIQPFCSPLNDVHNSEDTERFSLSNLSIFENSEPDFNTVLKGDPSFTCNDSLFSEEVCFYQQNECAGSNPTLNATRCSSAQTSPLKEYTSQVSELEKYSVLSNYSDVLLGVSSLDQLFDEGMNERMETLCENNSELTTKPVEDLNERLNTEEKREKITHVSKVIGREVSRNSSRYPRRLCTKKTEKASKSSSIQINPISDAFVEDSVRLDFIPSKTENPVKQDPVEIVTRTVSMSSTSKKSEPGNLKPKCESSPNKSQLLNIKTSLNRMLKKDKKITIGKHDDWDMTNAEIERYFSQLNNLSYELSKQAVSKKTEPVIWLPIRHAPTLLENKIKPKRRKFGCKSKKVLKQHSGHKLSKKEMNKLTSCFVLLEKLSVSKLNLILKPKDNCDQIHRNLENCNKKRFENNDDSDLEIEMEEKKVPVPLAHKHTMMLQHQTESEQCDMTNEGRETCLSSSLVMKKPKKLHSSTVHDLSVIKHCQIVLNREGRGLSNETKDKNNGTKHPIQSKKLENVTLSTLPHKKEFQARLRTQKQFEHLLNNNSVSNLSSENDNTISQCKVNEDLKQSTNKSKNNSENSNDVREKLKFCKELPLKSTRKKTLNNFVSPEVKNKLIANNTFETLPPTKPFQIVLMKHDLKSKFNQKENLNKVVRLVSNTNSPFKKVDKFENSSTNLESQPQHLKPLRKRNASLNRNLNQNSQEKSLGITPKRRKSLNVVSLDGTCDNSSSSDENVPEPSRDVKCTPNKSRKSSSNVTDTPKSKYVPLQVEIKKSPTVKLERIPVKGENKSDFKGAMNLSPISETKNTLVCSTSKISQETCTDHLVRMEQLSQDIKSLDAGEIPAGSHLKMYTKAYPLIKKLKISVKRWSTDEKANSGNEPLKTKKMMYRRCSLPVTAK